MIKSNFFKQTVDADLCIKLKKDMDDAPKFIKKHKLTLNEFRYMEYYLAEIWKFGQTKTFMSKVKDVFEKYGFTTELCDEINYKIS